MQAINRIRKVEPTPGTDAEAAYAVHLDEGPEPHVLIEYAAGGGGKHASEGHARTLVQDYLGRGESPPSRIGVDRDGNASPHVDT
jgi:hypothetical protein